MGGALVSPELVSHTLVVVIAAVGGGWTVREIARQVGETVREWLRQRGESERLMIRSVMGTSVPDRSDRNREPHNGASGNA